MKYELFSSLYAEALGYADVDMFVGERGWQDWMDAYPTEQIADMLQDIYFLAHASIREVREKHGYSRAAFARLFRVPIRTNEDWDKDPKLIKDYVKIPICYALFESDRHVNG